MWPFFYADAKGEVKRVPPFLLLRRVVAAGCLVVACVLATATVTQQPWAAMGRPLMHGQVPTASLSHDAAAPVDGRTAGSQEPRITAALPPQRPKLVTKRNPRAPPKPAAAAAAAAKQGVLRDLSSLREPRHKLAQWVGSGAGYEELRYLFWFKQWLSKTPRTLINVKLEALVPIDEWVDCSLERKNCTCKSGKVRFGDVDRDVWMQIEPAPGETLIECSKKRFGADPVPGIDKICQCGRRLCPDGLLANDDRCPASDPKCEAACNRDWIPRRGGPSPRAELCKARGVTHELLWSCNASESRVPSQYHPDAAKQAFLYKATSHFCSRPEIADQMETYLDCNYLENYLRYTSEDSEWLQEAYITYIGGKKKTTHERRTTNTIRSVEAFSTRPLVVVVVDGIYEPPAFWQSFKCLIVYRMQKFPAKLPFNLNKLRAMMTMRVGTGAQLDGDSLIFVGMDKMFEPTRREVTPEYPFPIMPVHYSCPDKGFERYPGPRSMRWNHAHPTWTHWAIPFMMNVYYWRVASLALKGTKVELWNIKASGDGMRLASATDINTLLWQDDTTTEKAEILKWMTSDEPMTNVMLWMAGAKKAWCKYDLDPSLYLRGRNMEKRLFGDEKWYPVGLPVIFYSMHNTKNDKDADFLVSLLIYCQQLERPFRIICPSQSQLNNVCRTGLDTPQNRFNRGTNPDRFTTEMCCCVEPRSAKPFLWRGEWYKESKDVPTQFEGTPRKCLLP